MLYGFSNYCAACTMYGLGLWLGVVPKTAHTAAINVKVRNLANTNNNHSIDRDIANAVWIYQLLYCMHYVWAGTLARVGAKDCPYSSYQCQGGKHVFTTVSSDSTISNIDVHVSQLSQSI